MIILSHLICFSTGQVNIEVKPLFLTMDFFKMHFSFGI